MVMVVSTLYLDLVSEGHGALTYQEEAAGDVVEGEDAAVDDEAAPRQRPEHAAEPAQVRAPARKNTPQVMIASIVHQLD
jgi:hypothetical protein